MSGQHWKKWIAFGELTLATVLAFDTFGRAWLRALLGRMARLLAVTASKLILTRSWAVADTMADLITVVALYLELFLLHRLLWALLGNVTHLVTVLALRNTAISWLTGIGQALQVILSG